LLNFISKELAKNFISKNLLKTLLNFISKELAKKLAKNFAR
jgi:hypothetical protein